MATFPERIDVSVGDLQSARGVGVVLRVLDDAERQPLHVIVLTPGQTSKLLADLVRATQPGRTADEILALLP